MNHDPILQVLGEGGLLSRAIPGYELRPQQLRMAQSVLGALERDRYLLAEAGTGTGKTLAYLLPAILSGKKVVVSTATKTLQEQIYFKDLPLLARVLGIDVRAAYMKGRSNYLCRTRFEAFAEEPKFAAKAEAQSWPEIRSWAAATESGDRAELDLPEGFATWRELSATSETCTGQRCPAYESCFVTAMRRKAQEASLVVVNHHLFFADLALKSSGEDHGAEVIPRYDAVIFDEAHALEEIATDYFGVQLSTYRIEELVRDATREVAKIPSLVPLLAPLIGRVEGRGAGFFSSVEAATGLVRGGGRSSTPHAFASRGSEDLLGGQRPAQPPRDGQDATVRLAPGALGGCAQERSELLHALGELTEAASGAPDVPELEAIARRCVRIADELSFVSEVGEGGVFVHYVERRGRGTFLRAAPIEIADELARRLYATLPSAVFTSATLAVTGRFDYVRRRLGIEDHERELRVPLDELQVGSPFDYRRQAALYLPTHLPEPQDRAFIDEATWELEQLFALTGGRAFALFTSVRNMQRAHALLEPRLPYRVLLQGELPKARLIERFVETPSVLFATASFWEGVDVPGDALSLVVIDKLPFASPTDPVVAARIDALRAGGGDPFGAYQVPQAAIALRQGFGRLVRTRSDRGIVAILDKRITTKGYGRQFLRSLPDCPRFGRLEHVERWWTST
ncbi:ATP-dependent DNA helicase [Vulgatibacter incomptus]|uniref:DNA 5'-3' helicase n=1 Tax=Vulgatibacter incomptus TaxID=1391653 RepID=A0A0K1PIV3_9BACT|nr:ATP-dependent DNA helicase [Vulgatibacter incomptus]AKU93039.1 DinG family ATP-dependent helicase YoaA [Vulgatibacter incomptus]